MRQSQRSLVLFVAGLLVAGVVATGAVGRPEGRVGVPGPLAADSIACADAGGVFHPEPWRVPPDTFAGYHCLFQSGGVPVPVPDDAQAAAEKRCVNAHRGEFMQIAVAAYAGYACTWLRD
jgi:hypothetical protein